MRLGGPKLERGGPRPCRVGFAPRHTGQLSIAGHTQDTRCCLNVRSKADASQLCLPHGTDNENVENRKTRASVTDRRTYDGHAAQWLNCSARGGWWIRVDARLGGPKLEPEGPRAEVGFPTADQGFSSIQGTLFGFCGI